MKKAPQIVSLAVCLILLNTFAGCSRKANNSQATASKFIGTWRVAPESESDFKGGPITFKEDNTYSALETSEQSARTLTGPFTVSTDGKLFLGGELTKFGEEGLRIEPDGRMRLPKRGQNIYFVKG
jgi:hypothetical protein